MKVCVISDTHQQHSLLQLEECDLLIHGGDISHTGQKHEFEDFFRWFERQPGKDKLLIAGNHDFKLDEYLKLVPHKWFNFLHHDHITINDYTFFGSPFTPNFYNWAYMYDRGPDAEALWDEIPSFTDVLITHGPPQNIGDETISGIHCGCKELRERVREINPRYHFFGHIHEGAGVYTPATQPSTTFVNASVIDHRYRITNEPYYFTLPDKHATFEI